MSSSVAVEWAADRAAIDGALAALCAAHEQTVAPRVADAVKYSLLGGGKRLRGLLFLASC